MNTKHTPGPWTVRENPNGTIGIDAMEDGAPCQPAKINGDATDPVYGPVTRANARLISAAPDLLAALKGIIETVSVRIDDPRIKHFDAARAAIAKAEGGAS